MQANIQEALRSLFSAKQRTILALIGIVIGIGSVIAMVSIGKIVQEQALKQFEELGTDILTIRKNFERTVGTKAKSQGSITLEEAQAITAHCPSVIQTAPFVTVMGEISFAGKKIQGNLLGATQSLPDLNKLKIKKGRFLSDLDQFSTFCVLGYAIFQKIREMGLSDPIGQSLKVGDRLFTVIGVLEDIPMGSGMRPFQPNENLYLHITTALRMQSRVEISTITTRIRPGFHYRVAQMELKEYFTQKTQAPNVSVVSPEELISQMEKQMGVFTILLGAIGSISLIVGGVGVMNVMLVSVTERRKEIGIRRALGAKRSDIKSQFLIESLLLSMLGGFFGILLGVGVSFVIAYFAKWQFLISWAAVIIGVGVSSAVGIFFGFYPARQASRLDPIVALRSD